MESTVFAGKTLLITGGTGSFGNTVLKHFLSTDIGEIRIFSRDEKKQDDMRHDYQLKYPELSDKQSAQEIISAFEEKQQLADLVHVSSRTIISLEKGQYNPSLLLAYRLALVFRTTVEDLYCLAENKEQEDRENEEWT